MDMLVLSILVCLALTLVVMYVVFSKTKKLDESKSLDSIQEDVYTTNLLNNLESNKTEEQKLVSEVIELGQEILDKMNESEVVVVPVSKKKTSKKKTSKKKAAKKKAPKKKPNK